MSDLPSGRQVLTELEYRVVCKYCELEGKTFPLQEDIALVSRHRNPVGFMTDIRIEGGTDIQWTSRVYNRLPSARVGAAGNLVGVLMFFGPDRTIAVEGFAYGGAWPASKNPIEFVA